jgi:hypothetical protein
MHEISPIWDEKKVPRCHESCPFRQEMGDDDGEHQWYYCGKTGIALPETDICIPAYDRKVSELERSVESAAKTGRQEEKRKWFAKIRSKEFWEALRDGEDGEEGIAYIESVSEILRDVMGWD